MKLNRSEHSCPICENESRLEFLPLVGGTVYARCPDCGYTWEVQKEPETVN